LTGMPDSLVQTVEQTGNLASGPWLKQYSRVRYRK
jgi:hypothetical protein